MISFLVPVKTIQAIVFSTSAWPPLFPFTCRHVVATRKSCATSWRKNLLEGFTGHLWRGIKHGVKLDGAWYFGSECDGGFAQYAKVAERHAYRIESDMTDVELASFPCSYSTAENMLTRARVGEDDIVLVTGASGGVGSATVQLARARGAQVHAITSPAKAETLKELGVSKALNRDADLVAELGAASIDVVIDLVAGPGWPALMDVLRPGGRYAVAGAIGGPMVELDVRTLYLKDLSFFGCTVLEPQVFANLVRRIERNEIKPLIAETHPLKDIAEAQKSFGEKGYIGKIVLEIP